MIGEEILYDSNDIKVTPARVVIRATTYAVANITSIKAIKDDSKRNLGFLLILLGVLAAFVEIYLIGAILLLVGALLVKFGSMCILVFTTGAAEQQALRSRDQARIVEVASAVNLAIMKRSALPR